jgi:hypothetical protein
VIGSDAFFNFKKYFSKHKFERRDLQCKHLHQSVTPLSPVHLTIPPYMNTRLILPRVRVAQQGMRSRHLLLPLALAIVAICYVRSGTAQNLPNSSPANQPVGLDIYRKLDRIMEIPSGGQTREIASTDPAEGNGDFNHVLRVTPLGSVLAEASGPGEIVSIWSTINFGDVTADGTLTIELDGKVVISAPFQNVVSGRLGAPFVWPLVGNGDDTSGGVQIKVPMTYQHSMRVTTQNNPQYYHVIYRRFNSATGLSTFNPSDPSADVIAKLRAFGINDPKPARTESIKRQASLNVPTGSSDRAIELHGAGSIRELRLSLPQVQRAPRIIDDCRAFGSGGSSQFVVTIDPRNTGIRLTRRLDPSIGHQVANVYVDSVLAGQWSSGPVVPAGSWVDETVNVPASLTAGKSKITVTNQFVSSDLDFNEFRYDVSCEVGGEWTRSDVVDVGPNHPGEESAHGYSITAQTFQGTRTFRYSLDAETVANSYAILSGARLRLTFDGQTTVDAPLGEFFGSGLGKYDVRSLFFSIDASSSEGWYSSWWPMPFARSVTLEIVNNSGIAIQGGKVEVTYDSDPTTVSQLAGDFGYFHATYNRTQTAPGEDYQFLDTTGRGVFYGVTHTMRGEQGNARGYLEGNEHFYVNDELSPSWSGTGTEDFYESGWYFRNGTTYVMPFSGNPAYDVGADGFDSDTTGAFRLFIGESIPFGQRIRAGIEHGPVNDDVLTNYSSVAFWYGQPTYSLKRTDAFDPSDPVSRKIHHYTSSGDTSSSLDALFPAAYYYLYPVNLGLVTTAHAFGFQMAIDPANNGVRLARLSDASQGYQTANVYIDGALVGSWLQPVSDPDGRWLEDTFSIPANFTRGKAAVNVQVVPVTGVTGNSNWTASHYEAISEVQPFSRHRGPEGIHNLQATGEQTNAIQLSWQPALAQISVSDYEIYGSTDPAFPADAAHLIAKSPIPGFEHFGLGLNQSWSYQVRAIDASGVPGPFSSRVSAQSGNSFKVEAESLLPPVSATATWSAQGNCCGVTWSGSQQLFFQATKVGDSIVLAVNVPIAGLYDLSAAMTKAPDYGIVSLAVDGNPLGGPFDGFNAGSVTVNPSVDFGNVQLAAGSHLLTFTLTGKNSAAINYYVGIDFLLFKKTQ